MNVILFLIQWLGGVYCIKKEDKYASDWAWVYCIFVGWIIILIYLWDEYGSSRTSTSNASSETTTATEQPMTANDNILNEARTITDYQSYMEVLKQYYLEYKEEIFLPSKIQNFIDEYQLDSKLGIHSDDVMKDLWKIRKTATEENNSTCIPPEQPKNEQTPIETTTPPVQAQRTQTQNANNNILDEHILIETVRAMPLWLNTESVNISENSSINNLCAGLANKAVSDIMAGETLMQFENIIHQKRLRTPNKTEYDRKMENNILYELFCYSYLVNVIEAVPKKLNGSLNVDFEKYISLAENECRKRVQNLEQEKKNTRSIEVILNQYTRSTAQYKMPILGFINQRENDFIIAQLMHNCIIPCIAPLFYDSKEQWQTFNTVSAKEFAQTLDVYLSQGISMRLSMYAGDKIFNI